MQKIFKERFKTFKTLKELNDYALNNNIAMISDTDYMSQTFGSTCKFYPIKKLQISYLDWANYGHKGSTYIPIINHQ